MYFRIICKDISKSKLITLTTMIFVIVAALLVSLSAILMVNLSGAINTLMTQAKTPHFMQMHTGEIDTARLMSFAEQNSYVDAFQVLEFLNIDGADIIIGENSLADNVQDNGLCTQSGKFDFLLDLDGNIINVSEGQIYVPICYMKDNTAKIGDTAVICGKELRVTGFLRDSQMNSTLSSSKRFLVNEKDYAQIRGLGNIEYLIEFTLKDLSTLGAFETAYVSAGIEANGPTITYPLFKVINAMNDGLMIAVILLVSALVVSIAFMCIRFTLVAKIEDDYRQIGVMKAIGLRVAHIKKIYLAKYAALSVVGCVLGFALSFVFRGMLLENIRLYMGESGNSSFATLFGVLGVLIVFIAITSYVNGVLSRFRKISAAQAIRFGTSQEKATGAKHFYLSKNRLLPANIYLGIKDVLARKGIYGTMLAVLVISSFIIIVPQNLYNTIKSKEFIKYMGIGKSDILIGVAQTDEIHAKVDEITKKLKSDSLVSRYTVLTTRTYKVKMSEGSEERIKVELGDHSVFPIRYSEGSIPTKSDEIALSVINAAELGKKVGDAITLMAEGKERVLTICGTYSDITNGGKTAKAAFSDHSSAIMWCVISVELSDKAQITGKISEYTDQFNYAKIKDIEGYSKQTFGPTVNSIGKASMASIAVALILSALVSLLFIKMLVTKDKYSIATTKALGFTNKDIITQYISRSVFVLLVGIALGTLLANTLGAVLAGTIITSLGASSFQFEVNLISAYILCPLMMIGSVLLATIIGASGVVRIKISENIKE